MLPDLSILSVLRGSSWEQKVSGAAELAIILLLLLLVVIHEAPVAAKRDARSSGCRWSSRVSFASKVSHTHSLSVVFTLFITILSELSSSSPAALCSSTDPLAAILLYARLALFAALSLSPSHVGQGCQKCDKIGRVARTFCGGLVVMLSVVAVCHFRKRRNFHKWICDIVKFDMSVKLSRNDDSIIQMLVTNRKSKNNATRKLKLFFMLRIHSKSFSITGTRKS